MQSRVCYTYNGRKLQRARLVEKSIDLFSCEGGKLMPHKPKKPCAYPNCPTLTDGTYCEEHKKTMREAYDKYSRLESYKKKYGHEWVKIRARYVSEHPLCEMCLKEGRYKPMEEVHHILPVSRGGTNDETNLMSLCRSCHNKVHIELGDRHPHES